nr:MAG TPA: hypothetical protein [Caudoviricetes sp.]
MRYYDSFHKWENTPNPTWYRKGSPMKSLW